jgi:hypothetical protein
MRDSAASGKSSPAPSRAPATSLAHEVAIEPSPKKVAPSVAALTGRWDELVTRVRTSGKALLAAALESASPASITSKGDLTIALDEPNDFHAKAIEQASADVLGILREWFDGIERIALRRDDTPRRDSEKPRRVTDEMVKTERLNTLRRKDATLDAAIDVLDLEIAD